MSTLAGQAGVSSFADGQGTAASLHYPMSIAVDSSGNLYAADGSNQILKIDPSGIVTTLAGQRGVAGSADGQGTAASFNAPIGIAVDFSGNLYVADTADHLIRKLTPRGTSPLWPVRQEFQDLLRRVWSGDCCFFYQS